MYNRCIHLFYIEYTHNNYKLLRLGDKLLYYRSCRNCNNSFILGCLLLSSRELVKC